MVETGLATKLYKMFPETAVVAMDGAFWCNNEPQVSDEPEQHESIKLVHLKSCISFVIYGSLASFIVLILELVLRGFKRLMSSRLTERLSRQKPQVKISEVRTLRDGRKNRVASNQINSVLVKEIKLQTKK